MSLIITAVFDGPITGGVPKGIELYVTADIADLSAYGVGSANNGGGTDGQEFTFPAIAAEAGSYIYVASEAVEFANFFGFAPDYTSFSMAINGDDAIELFENGAIIDTFGDPNVDGTGQAWEHLDGWAARTPGTAPNPTFNIADWSFSGPNALDGETTNADAATPIPVGSYGTLPPPPVERTITINEIDADNPSTDSAEFIELYDGGAGNTSLDGLTVVLFNGSNDSIYRTIDLDGQMTNDDGFFVIGSANVPNVDLVEFTTNGLQNGADAVAIYEDGAPEVATTDGLVDAIVYDTNDSDDTGLLEALGLTVQYNEGENGASDADALARDPDGSGDFVAQAPTPGETNEIVLPPPPAEITMIHEIQGSGGTGAGDVIGVDDISALEGQIVTVSAIVTADFQNALFGTNGDRDGFYVQEEDADQDADALTSEGIFIFDGSNPDVDVQVGDLVEITGTVSEFFGQSQITATALQVISSNQLLPTTVEVNFPTATVADDGNGNYVANLEAYEGMLVTLSQQMTITETFNLDRFGQYNVTEGDRPAQFTQTNDPDAEGNDAYLQNVASRTIVLDDGFSNQNPDDIRVLDGNDGILSNTDTFSMGDQLADITGVVSYSFGEYRIDAPTGTYEDTSPRDEAPEDIGGNFKVASLNVLNYFTTIDESGVTTDNGSDPRGADSLDELERQATKLVNAIVAMDADVIGLIEIENDFAGETFAIKDLVERVNAELGAQIYAFVDPGQEFVGGDAISNGLIYKSESVTLKGDMAILEMFEDRDFIDPLSAGRGLNRPAIAQTFEDVDTGETITISVNHLKSKGSLSGIEADNDQGDGQGNNNATRAEAADILGDWMNSDPTGQGADNLLILGDLNAYAKEDPLTELSEDGFTDLAAQELGDDAYSYVFDGLVGTLDYALANDTLTGKLAGVTEWHINANEADAFDYNLDFGRDPSLFDGDTAARNSDHDPVIVSFDFEQVLNPVVGTAGRDILRGTDLADAITGLAGRDFIRAGDGNDVIDAGADRDIVFAGDGDDTIITGNGRGDLIFGGEGGDTFVFSAELAENGRRDSTKIMDFDVTEDIIDLGGADIARVSDRFGSTVIKLEGGDSILLIGVDDADDVVYANELLIL